MWELVRFVIEKLDKEDWYSRIIILESIGSLKMNKGENLWDLWMIKIFVIEKLDKGEYSWIIKIIIILENIGNIYSLKMNKELWELVRFVIEIFMIEKLNKEGYWYLRIIILESIGSLKMNIKDCKNLWKLVKVCDWEIR